MGFVCWPEGGRATGELGQLVCAVGLCQNLGALCAPLPPVRTRLCAPGCAHPSGRAPARRGDRAKRTRRQMTSSSEGAWRVRRTRARHRVRRSDQTGASPRAAYPIAQYD